MEDFECLIAIMEEMRAKMDVNQAKTEASLKELKALMDVNLDKTEDCMEKMEENPEEIDAVMEHQEDPNEEAAVETIRAFVDRSGDQQPFVGYQNPLKRRTQVDDVCEAPKKQAFEKRRWMCPECNNGIRGQSIRQQLHLEGKGDTLQGCQADPRDGGHQIGSQVFHQAPRNECLDTVEELDPSKME
jgi:hypothetical protein